MYLEYILNQPSVIQEMAMQSDPIVDELKYFNNFIENVIFENIDKLIGENANETFLNIRNYTCDRTIDFIDHTVSKLSR